MPCCMFYTNVATDKIPQDFEEVFANEVARVLYKAPESVKIIINEARVMTRGSKDPSVTVFLYAVNRYDSERNPTYTEPLCTVISRYFNVPIERCLILYMPIEKYQLGLETQ